MSHLPRASSLWGSFLRALDVLVAREEHISVPPGNRRRRRRQALSQEFISLKAETSHCRFKGYVLCSSPIMDVGFKPIRVMYRLKSLGDRLDRILTAAAETRQRAERMLIRSRQGSSDRRENVRRAQSAVTCRRHVGALGRG